MKSKLFTLILLLASLTCSAQIAGTWHGKLQVTSVYSLSLVLHITEEGNQLSATLDSPDQGATGIPVDKVEYNTTSKQLTFESLAIGARYQGILKNDTIQGVFAQGGMPRRLDLSRGEVKKEEVVLPYNSEEVSIPSGDVMLSGTLTSPKEGGKSTALLLIAGSGPNNRDEQIGPHKPLYDIADYLTKEGYTVLRYDKRGIGKSTGSFSASLLSDLQADAVAAAQFLRSYSKFERVGIIGHSEGGLIAQMIAAETPQVTDFIILLAAPGTTGIETVVYQNAVMMAHLIKPSVTEQFRQVTQETFSQLAYKEQDRTQDSLLMLSYFDKVLPLVKEDQREQTKEMVYSDQYLTSMLNALTPYFKGFLRTTPKKYLRQITCPILAINGSMDMQVEADANLSVFKTFATESKEITVLKVEGLNHLFLPSKTGLPQEYFQLKPGFSPEVLHAISDWLLK